MNEWMNMSEWKKKRLIKVEDKDCLKNTTEELGQNISDFIGYKEDTYKYQIFILRLDNEKRKKESWSNNTLNFQLVPSSVRPLGSTIKDDRMRDNSQSTF